MFQVDKAGNMASVAVLTNDGSKLAGPEFIQYSAQLPGTITMACVDGWRYGSFLEWFGINKINMFQWWIGLGKVKLSLGTTMSRKIYASKRCSRTTVTTMYFLMCFHSRCSRPSLCSNWTCLNNYRHLLSFKNTSQVRVWLESLVGSTSMFQTWPTIAKLQKHCYPTM